MAHLIRAARKLSESTNPKQARIGKWVKDGLQRICKMKGQQLTQAEVDESHRSFRNIVDQYFSTAAGEAKMLLDRIDAEYNVLSYFLMHPGIEPTNNHAERTIRPAVILRKTMYGSASFGGETYMERLLSLRLTCNLQSVSFYETLKSAMTYHFDGKKPNLRWLSKPHWQCMHNFGKKPHAFPGKLYSE